MNLDIKLIQNTFELVKPRAEEFANRFFTNLFADYPSSQAIFGKSNMEKQKRMLVASLVQVVQNLERPEFLGEYLGKIGERYASYGATEEHFVWVGLSLLKTQKEMLGIKWTAEYTQQWAMAFDVVAALINEGMNRHTPALEQKPKIFPLRKTEPEKSVTAFNLRFTLPRELTEHLDQLAKQAVRQAAQEYFDLAIQREMTELTSKNLQDLLRKAS